jgi:hypothetical protein
MLAVGAFVLLLAGAVVSAVPALRRRRRRRIRRRQPDPRARVLGAWAETREALQRLGPDLTAATMDDVVVRLRATDHELSGPATTMASLVDRAVYAPAVDGVPALTGRDADRAWSTGRALVSGVRRCRWRQRRRRWRALVRSGRCRPGADATER